MRLSAKAAAAVQESFALQKRWDELRLVARGYRAGHLVGREAEGPTRYEMHLGARFAMAHLMAAEQRSLGRRALRLGGGSGCTVGLMYRGGENPWGQR